MYEDGVQPGTTTDATLEYGEPKPSSCGSVYPVSIDHSVWYKVTPKYTSYVEFTPFSSISSTSFDYSFDIVLNLYKGSSLTSLQRVTCTYTKRGTQNPMKTTLQAGQTYYLQLASNPTSRVGGGSYEMGSFSLKVDWGCYVDSYGIEWCLSQ
jgi:hypothetical protein